MRQQKRHISLKDHPNISPEGKEQVKKLAEESGYRRIAYITGPSYLNISSGRERGYIDGLKENHIEFNKDYLVQCEMNPGSATEATWKQLALPDPPDAIFGIYDRLTFAAMKEIRRQGVRILSPIPLLKWLNSWLSFSLKAWEESSHPGRWYSKPGRLSGIHQNACNIYHQEIYFHLALCY